MADDLLDSLRRIVGTDHVLVDADLRAGYEHDWTGRWHGRALAVVRPADTAEVAAVVTACADAATAMTPLGGNTGLVGGGIPSDGAVTLSTERLGDLGAVDPVTGQVTVGAGATLAATAAHVGAEGWDVGVDLGARDSATIGGMAATNAGGIHVLAHGMMRQRVVGIEAVTADGTVLSSLRGLVKDNTGYDLTGLLVGSEGTLGIITAVRLALVPRPAHRVTVLVGVDELADAVTLATDARRRVPSLVAVEWCQSGIVDAPDPLPRPARLHVLLEAAGAADPTDDLARILTDHGLDAAVADDDRGRAGLWHHRESQTETLAARGGHQRKADVAVPPGDLADLLHRVRLVVGGIDAAADVVAFGHLGDGNAHITVTGLSADTADDVHQAILRTVADLGGSISAEHGIGRSRAALLGLNRSPQEIAAMWAIKDALDPRGLLNPGAVLPARVPAPEA